MALRLVIAEDSLLVREGVARLLDGGDDIEITALCEDYDQLMAAVDHGEVDVVLTDIRMPPTGTDEGIRAASQLRASHPEVGVVVLSQYAEPEYALALLEDGSAGRAYQYDDPHHSKAVYVRARLMTKDEPALLELARKVLADFEDDALASMVAALSVSNDAPGGPVKNIIFASAGPKPEIVLRDAIANDIEITAHAESCLVYDRPLYESGLSWRELVAWWREDHPADRPSWSPGRREAGS